MIKKENLKYPHVTGSDIKNLREAQALSMGALARAIGSYSASVWDVENGKVKHSILKDRMYEFLVSGECNSVGVYRKPEIRDFTKSQKEIKGYINYYSGGRLIKTVGKSRLKKAH